MAPPKGKRYPKKQPKPALAPDAAAKAKLNTLASQLEGGFLTNALKTVTQLLQLLPNDPLLSQTHAQLLLALDQFDQAAQIPLQTLETAYAQYKQGHLQDALQTVDAVKESEGDSRELRLLEAQIRYKLEDYEAAASLYQELIVTAHQDSPEYVDIEHNLNSSEAFLSYRDELVGTASAQSGPLSTTLEEQPVGLLVAQKYPSHRVHASTSSAAKTHSSGKERRSAKLPAKIAEMSEEQRPPVDPERWLPKHLRSDYVDPRRNREEERRRKQKEKMSVQGSGSQSNASAPGGGKSKSKGKKRTSLAHVHPVATFVYLLLVRHDSLLGRIFWACAMARETPSSSWIQQHSDQSIANVDRAPDVTSLFSQDAPAHLLDESTFAWHREEDQSDEEEYGHVDETQADFGLDVWEQVRRATRSTLGETSAILKAASPSKPRQSIRDLPPLLPTRRPSQLPKPTSTNLQRSQTDSTSRLSQRLSLLNPNDLRRSVLQRSTSTTALPQQPPRSAMKSKSTLSRSVNKSVAFAPVQDVSLDLGRNLAEESEEHTAATRLESPDLALPPPRASTSQAELHQYARQVFAPASPLPSIQPTPVLASPQVTVSHAPLQDDSFLPGFSQNMMQEEAPRSTVTSTPKPGRAFTSSSHSRSVSQPSGSASRHALQDPSLSHIEAGSSSQRSSASIIQHQSIADLTASVARDALDRAMRSFQQQPDGLAMSQPGVPPVQHASTSQPAAFTSPADEPVLQQLPVSSQPASASRSKSRSASGGQHSRRVSVGVQADTTVSMPPPLHSPSPPPSPVQASHERSWSEPSMIFMEPSPDDMFARRVRDAYLHKGLDLSQDAPGVVHSVTGYQLPPGPPVVHLPPPSHHAGRAVRPTAKIVPDLQRPASVHGKRKDPAPTLTVPREFNFHKSRAREPTRQDDMRPAKRPKVNASAAFAPPAARTSRTTVTNPSRKQNRQGRYGQKRSRTAKPAILQEEPFHAPTQLGLTAEALRQQQDEMPLQEAYGSDDRMAHYLNSIDHIEPTELDSPAAPRAPVVSFPTSSAAPRLRVPLAQETALHPRDKVPAIQQSQTEEQSRPVEATKPSMALGDKTNKARLVETVTSAEERATKKSAPLPFTFQSDVRAARQKDAPAALRKTQQTNALGKGLPHSRTTSAGASGNASRPFRPVPRGETGQSKTQRPQAVSKPFTFSTAKRKRGE